MATNQIVLTSDIDVNLIQHVGGDALVLAALRVLPRREEIEELQKAIDNHELAGVINYLVRHRHGTPFEHAVITVYCHAPIFVWRQWHRHRIGFSFNEQSERYGPIAPVFWVPRRERPFIVPEDHKPARPMFLQSSDEVLYESMLERSMRIYSLAYEAYQEEVSLGIALEVARRHLPLSIYSGGWVTCNPRSLMRFLSIRTHDSDARWLSYPQAEIEEAARGLEQILKNFWPITYQAFVDNGRVGP